MNTDNPTPTVQGTALLLALNATSPVERIMLLAMADRIDARRERTILAESAAARSESRRSDRRSVLLGFIAPAVASVLNRVATSVAASVTSQSAAVN